MPILAMVMAPESVSTTLQSWSRAMASVTSNASPSERPLNAVLRHGAQQVGEGLHPVEVEALQRDEAVVPPVVELAMLAHAAILRAARGARKTPACDDRGVR